MTNRSKLCDSQVIQFNGSSASREIPGLEQHVRDLLSIFKYHRELELSPNKLCRWIVFRCYPKIQARLLGGSAKIWKTDPVTVINQWTPNERDRRTFQTYALSSRGRRKTTLKVNPVEMRSICKSDVGLLTHSGPNINGDFEFMFNIEDSSAWLRLVGRCIVRLRNMLLIQTDTTLKWKPDPIDDADLLRVDYYLRFLQLLLDFPAIKWLFSDSSLKFCFELKRSPGMPLHDQSHSYD